MATVGSSSIHLRVSGQGWRRWGGEEWKMGGGTFRGMGIERERGAGERKGKREGEMQKEQMHKKTQAKCLKVRIELKRDWTIFLMHHRCKAPVMKKHTRTRRYSRQRQGSDGKTGDIVPPFFPTAKPLTSILPRKIVDPTSTLQRDTLGLDSSLSP